MEFVQASETSKKKKQIRALTDGNSFSRIILVFEIMAERWRDFREEKKKLQLTDVQPGAEEVAEKEAEFRLFYITQGYMVCLVVLDIITNISIIFLGFRVIWQIIISALDLKMDSAAQVGVIKWWLTLTNIFNSAFMPWINVLKARLYNYQIGDMIFSKVDVLDIAAPLLMIMSIYIINIIITRSIRNNVVELLT